MSYHLSRHPRTQYGSLCSFAAVLTPHFWSVCSFMCYFSRTRPNRLGFALCSFRFHTLLGTQDILFCWGSAPLAKIVPAHITLFLWALLYSSHFSLRAWRNILGLEEAYLNFIHSSLYFSGSLATFSIANHRAYVCIFMCLINWLKIGMN
jgi:hypothetical protein